MEIQRDSINDIINNLETGENRGNSMVNIVNGTNITVVGMAAEFITNN